MRYRRPGDPPIKPKARRIPLQHLKQLYELLKGLLMAGLIAFSDIPCASPIVIVLKKNGVDIRLCIDYKMLNSVTVILEYAMPLVDDVPTDMKKYLWNRTLNDASGFWAVMMTQRARKISAFVCALGNFGWLRLPFGLNGLHADDCQRAVGVCSTSRSRFIQDFAVYGAALYQVREEDFGPSANLSTAKRGFAALQAKVAAAPILKHLDRAKDVHVMLFVNDWVLSTTHMTCYTQLATRTINAYTRFSTLGCIDTPKTRFGPSTQFAVMLSPWHLVVHRVKEDESAFAQLLHSTITNFLGPDETLQRVAPPFKRAPMVRMDPALLYERLPNDHLRFVLSFDGSVKTLKHEGRRWRLETRNPAISRGDRMPEEVAFDSVEHTPRARCEVSIRQIPPRHLIIQRFGGLAGRRDDGGKGSQNDTNRGIEEQAGTTKPNSRSHLWETEPRSHTSQYPEDSVLRYDDSA
ncbi:unnamed protein product [Phytophthora fragariaefolia]|uniref:Unnamed protein product n=1 Tax=Phytophthora fragariaefolia TaxID=1490495 RepID=A0A9W7CG46_9STRA|nr:unnamed protein product [Phytophthora fragariaefolia]